MSISAYKRTIRDTEQPRQIERRILARLTGQLEANIDNFDTTEDKIERLGLLSSGLRDILLDNNKVWMMMKHDLARVDNTMPDELKAGLISLALWVERQTNLVMGGRGKIAPLVNINRSIVDGLSGKRGVVLGEAS